MASAETLHKDAIIIDGVCPLLMDKKNVGWYIDGGVTVAVPTIAIREPAGQVLRSLGSWHRFVSENDQLCLIQQADNIRAAKQNKKMGIIFHFQGTDPIEDLSLIHI